MVWGVRCRCSRYVWLCVIVCVYRAGVRCIVFWALCVCVCVCVW